jgi:hypothetical protein
MMPQFHFRLLLWRFQINRLQIGIQVYDASGYRPARIAAVSGCRLHERGNAEGKNLI